MKSNKKILTLSISILLIFTLGCDLTGVIKALVDKPIATPPPIGNNNNQQDENSPLDWGNSSSNSKEEQSSTNPSTDWGNGGTSDTSDDVTLYYDDFSDPHSGWDRASSDSYMTDYTDYDSYNIQVYQNNYDAWANPGLYIVGDAIVGVTAKKSEGDSEDNYGVLCFYSGTPNEPSFYAFQLSSEGYAYISKAVDGSESFVETAQISKIPPNEPVDFRASCKADGHLQFWLNDVSIIDTYDFDVSPDGDVGLIAGTFSEAYFTSVAFDDFYATESVK